MQNYMKIWSVWLPRREGNKEGGRQRQKCNQGPSALITGINDFLLSRIIIISQLVVTPNEMVCL